MSPCESTQAHACDGTGGTTPPRVHALMPVAKNLVGFQGGIYALNTMQSHTEAATLQSPTSRPKCTNNFEVCTSRNGDGQGGLPCCGQNLPGDSRVQCIRENENFDRCVPGGCQLTDRLSDWDCNQGKQWPRPPGPPYAPPPPTPPPLPPKHPPPDSPPRVSSIRVASLSNTWQGTSGLEATELLPAAASLDAYLATSSSTISALQATELDAAQPQSPAVLAAAGSFVAALVLLYIGAWAKRRWAERPLIRPRHQRLDVSEEEFLKRDAANAEDVDQGQSPGGDGGGRAGAGDSVLPWRGLVLGSTSAAKDATAGAEETHLSSADLESPRRLDTPDVGMPDSPTCDHLDRVSLGTIPPSGVVVDPAAKARAAEAAAAAAALLSQQQQPKPQLLPPPPKAPPPGEQQPSRREAAKREAAERTAQVKQRTAQMKERNAALKLQLAEGGKVPIMACPLSLGIEVPMPLSPLSSLTTPLVATRAHASSGLGLAVHMDRRERALPSSRSGRRRRWPSCSSESSRSSRTSRCVRGSRPRARAQRLPLADECVAADHDALCASLISLTAPRPDRPRVCKSRLRGWSRRLHSPSSSSKLTGLLPAVGLPPSHHRTVQHRLRLRRLPCLTVGRPWVLPPREPGRSRLATPRVPLCSGRMRCLLPPRRTSQFGAKHGQDTGCLAATQGGMVRQSRLSPRTLRAAALPS